MDAVDRVGRNTIFGVLSNVGTRVLKFVGSIVFANVAGAAALGTLYLFMSLFRVGRRLTTFGMGQAITTRVAAATATEDQEQVGNLLVTSLLLRSIPLALIGVALLVAAHRVDAYTGLDGAAWLLFTVLAATVVLSTARAVLSGHKRVDLAGILDLTRDGVTTALQIVLVVLGMKAFGLIAGFVLGVVLVTVFTVLLVPSVRQWQPPDAERARSLLSFAKFAALDSMVGGEQVWLDVLLLGLFVGAGVTQGEIGVYGIAYSVSMLGFTLSSAVGRSLLPEISGSESAEHALVGTSLRYTTLLAVPLLFGAAVVGDLVLETVYSFGGGYRALVVLAAGTVPFSIYQPIHQVFYGRNRPEIAFAVSLTTTVVNAALNLLLIPRLGILGTAVSTSIAMTLALALGVGFLYRIGAAPTVPKRGWGVQVAGALVMAAMVTGARRLLGPTSTATWATVFLVAFGGTVYVLFMFVNDSGIRRRVRRRHRSLTETPDS
jgi:O-antigen/teichoic acid export membrane protein